jgi:hypothetical protein
MTKVFLGMLLASFIGGIAAHLICKYTGLENSYIRGGIITIFIVLFILCYNLIWKKGGGP